MTKLIVHEAEQSWYLRIALSIRSNRTISGRLSRRTPLPSEDVADIVPRESEMNCVEERDALYHESFEAAWSRGQPIFAENLFVLGEVCSFLKKEAERVI